MDNRRPDHIDESVSPTPASEDPGLSGARPNARPLILDIKGNSLDDGPGIRTVVFLKGCPLSCVWCHNPESKSPRAEISYDPEKCIGCDTCMGTCSSSAISRNTRSFIDRSICDLCFQCADTCPSGAIERVGRSMGIDEIVAEVVKDKPFFDNSGGGVTLSGGEPTLFMGFLSQLLERLRAKGIHTLLETCGHFDLARFQELVFPHVDTIYFDIKLMDEAEHKRWCRTGNQVVLKNFSELVSLARKAGKEILPRTPLVPGITDTDSNLRAIADFLKRLGIEKASLQEYNPMWPKKSLKIGVSSDFAGADEAESWMTRERVTASKRIFVDAGIEV